MEKPKLKGRHHAALTVLAQRTLSRADLRAILKASGSTVAECVSTLVAHGLVHPLGDDTREGVRLTQKGVEYVATLTLQDLTLAD